MEYRYACESDELWCVLSVLSVYVDYHKRSSVCTPGVVPEPVLGGY